jgi:hypothetical protein
MAGWALDRYTPPPPPDARVQTEALRAAFPAYHFAVVVHGDRTRFEAVSRDGGSLWCLISTDPREIWRELTAVPSPDDRC